MAEGWSSGFWDENQDWGWVLGAAKDSDLEAGSGTGIKGVLLN